MDLKKRLASLDKLTRKTTREPGALSLKNSGLKPEQRAIEELGLTCQETPAGPVFFRDCFDSLHPPHDPLPALDGFLSQWGGRSPSLAKILFLDTETTGLAGGTGTLAFLVGVSWFEKKGLVTRQLFLPSPACELAMLKYLSELAQRFEAIVTFNGASFDLPLLKTRALMNRLDHPWDQLQGWDLLVPSRRIWGNQLENCRQQSIEKAVEAPRRDSRDIEGSLIPQTWFDFLQENDSQSVEKVMYHNWRDMVGMGVIFQDLVMMARFLEDSPQEVGLDRERAWAMARIAERRGQTARSISWMEYAWKKTSASDLANRRFCLDLVRILKRSRCWSLVENVIAAVLVSHEDDPWFHREAAIFYEHRNPDLPRAISHALVAAEENRLMRLQRKLDQGKELH